jgi:hypothetical protein
MLLLDTDVMVDLLRGNPPAARWIRSRDPQETLAVVGLVVMELQQGCRNRQELNQLRRDLRGVELLWPTIADFERALDSFGEARLSHGTDLIDALIGECAVGLGLPLHTFNVRHFAGIPHLQTIQPYVR